MSLNSIFFCKLTIQTAQPVNNSEDYENVP